MRFYLVLPLSVLLSAVYSAPWAPHGQEPHGAQPNTFSEDLSPWDKPRPGIGKRQVSMRPGLQPTTEESGSNGRFQQQQRGTVSLTASPSSDDMHATPIPTEPRQTIQAPELPDEAIVPMLSSATGRRWGHPAIPHEKHNFPSTVDPPGATRSESTNTSSSALLIAPPHLSTFPAKPLPSAWTPINISDLNPPPLPTPTTGPIPGHGPHGCETTVMAFDPSPCKNLLTTHTTTTTVFSSINCHGCTSVHVLAPMYMCPAVIGAGNKTTAATPYTWVSTVCQTLTTPSQLTEVTTTGEWGGSTKTLPGGSDGGGHVHPPWTPVPETTTPLVWPTSMEVLPWFTVQNWHTDTWGALPPDQTG